MRVACVVIAGGYRTQLLDEEVIPSVVANGFDEVVVSGAHHEGKGYRYLHVPHLTDTTIDALMKRDAGTLATTSEVICYLCDDHAFGSSSVADAIRVAAEDTTWDVIVPRREAVHPVHGLIRVNNGEGEGYCGGHAGVFRRRVIEHRPWSAMPHNRLWDLWASNLQQQAGFQFVSVGGVTVRDLEPEHAPWQ